MVKTTNPGAVAERLHAGAIRLLRRVRVADSEAALSAPKLSALSVLVFAGPMSLKALAAAEQVKPPTMSKLVADLEAEALAVKTVDRADKRAVMIAATAKGRMLMEEGRKRRLALLTKSLRTLSARELQTLAAAAELMLALE